MEEEELKWDCLCSFPWNLSKVHCLPKAGVLEGGSRNHWKARHFILSPFRRSLSPCPSLKKILDLVSTVGSRILVS